MLEKLGLKLSLLSYSRSFHVMTTHQTYVWPLQLFCQHCSLTQWFNARYQLFAVQLALMIFYYFDLICYSLVSL